MNLFTFTKEILIGKLPFRVVCVNDLEYQLQTYFSLGKVSYSIWILLSHFILGFPKLLSQSVSTQLNESAVLKCFKDGFKQASYLQTRWFKNNTEIKSIEGRYLIFGNVLVILRTTVADEGNYTCQVAFKSWTHVNGSAVQRLSIEAGLLSLIAFMFRFPIKHYFFFAAFYTLP